MQNKETDFDFDRWAKLAKDDPEAYEDMRKKLIQEVIDGAAPEVKRRMEGLQWQIDQVRTGSTNPMSSCLKISKMMWDNVTGENGLIDNMRQLTEPEQLQKPEISKQSATIININDNNTDPEKS